jgi:hypothetical protein
MSADRKIGRCAARPPVGHGVPAWRWACTSRNLRVVAKLRPETSLARAWSRSAIGATSTCPPTIGRLTVSVMLLSCGGPGAAIGKGRWVRRRRGRRLGCGTAAPPAAQCPRVGQLRDGPLHQRAQPRLQAVVGRLLLAEPIDGAAVPDRGMPVLAGLGHATSPRCPSSTSPRPCGCWPRRRRHRTRHDRASRRRPVARTPRKLCFVQPETLEGRRPCGSIGPW